MSFYLAVFQVQEFHQGTNNKWKTSKTIGVTRRPKTHSSGTSSPPPGVRTEELGLRSSHCTESTQLLRHHLQVAGGYRQTTVAKADVNNTDSCSTTPRTLYILCACVPVCMSVYMCVPCMCVYVWLCVCTYDCVRVRMTVCVYVWLCVCACVYVCVYVCVCPCVSMNVCVYVCIYKCI